MIENLCGKGYIRAQIDGMQVRLDEEIELAKTKKHTIKLIVDRIVIDAGWSGEYKTVTILDIDKVLPQLGNPDKDFSLLVKAANISSIRDAGKAYESTGDFTINGLFNNFADPIPVEKDGKKVGKLKINGTGNVVSRIKKTDMTGEFTAKIKFEQTDINEKSPDAEIMKEMKKRV